jgi:hypothetical protein
MHATDGEKDRTGQQEDPFAGADADNDMGQPRKANPSDE